MARKAAPEVAEPEGAATPSPKAASAEAVDVKSTGPTASARPRSATRAQVFDAPVERTGLARKDVATVFAALTGLIGRDLGKDGPGVFTIPGQLKLGVVRKPATEARPGTSPFTGQPMTFQVRPARHMVRVRPLKPLKDLV